MQQKIIVVAGPTASGKSAHALSIAEEAAKQNQNPVIINADSQQLYRELRILTARPSAEEEARFPHKLYGTLDGRNPCSAGQWLKFAKMEIDWALSQGMQPIVVGGTGLYLKALMEGIAEIPDVAPEVRQQATSDFESMGKEAFEGRLREVDPEFFTRLKVYDRQRLIRAWEIFLASGKPISWWQKQETASPYPPDSFALTQVDVPREELYARCDERFRKMMEEGAIDEVKNLLALKLPPDVPVMKVIGVREFASHLSGDISLEEAIAAAQQATRNYAKRQLTWFRNQL